MQQCRYCCTKPSQIDQSEAPDEDILLYYIGITGKGFISPNILTKPEVVAKCVLDCCCCLHSSFCFLLAKCRVCEISIITMGNKSWYPYVYRLTTWQLVWIGENGHISFGVISWQEAECTASNSLLLHLQSTAKKYLHAVEGKEVEWNVSQTLSQLSSKQPKAALSCVTASAWEAHTTLEKH